MRPRSFMSRRCGRTGLSERDDQPGHGAGDAGRWMKPLCSSARYWPLSPQPGCVEHLGVALAEKKDYAEAMKCYEAALQIKPELTSPRVNLGKVLAQRDGLKRPSAIPAGLVLCPDNFDAKKMNWPKPWPPAVRRCRRSRIIARSCSVRRTMPPPITTWPRC